MFNVICSQNGVEGVLVSEGWWEAWQPSPSRGNQELLLVRDKNWKTPGVIGVTKSMECDIFPSVLWHCWLGDRKGIRPVKKLDVGLLVVMIWQELCTTYSSLSPVVTTTSIILCFNKHRPTQVHLEWPLKWSGVLGITHSVSVWQFINFENELSSYEKTYQESQNIA